MGEPSAIGGHLCRVHRVNARHNPCTINVMPTSFLHNPAHRGGVFAWLVLLLLAARSAFAEPVGWAETRALEAPEAFQAAAAHGDWVFAIANSQVAKYDRATGKRMAMSTGEAAHLNSGFVWEGKLYCAHSNYPLVPEKSEIKVLDLESMKLTTFKDFGNFGGSLTWAVRHDDAWWCNFAHYGDANAKTFVVRLDDEWREQGRWTYPPEVLKAIGRNSLSGGIWLKDDLLVTDHDNRVIYRLRLPKEGGVLEFIAKEPAPFTGQGFAIDAKTGGLVGINRAKRQVIFAERLEP
jgi:hypothetical protein